MLKPKTFKWKKTYKNKKREFYYSLISFGYLFIVEPEIKECWDNKKKYHYNKTIYKAKMESLLITQLELLKEVNKEH